MEEIYHKYQKYEGKDVVAIYVNYPDEYEFSLDFKAAKEKISLLAEKVRQYAYKNLNNVTNETALLVLNGVIVGTILLTTLNGKINAKEVNKINNNQEISVANKQEHTIEEMSYTKEYVEEKKQEENTNKENTNNVQSSVNYIASKNNSQGNINYNASTSNNTADEVKNNQSTEETSNNQVVNDTMVSVRLNSGQIISLPLEEYIIGVVGAEMPASFHVEALKAQSVAARTYALKRIASSSILSATTSDQVYKTNDELRNTWGSGFDTYYNKVKNAVYATKGQAMTYNGSYIDALYFSTSNGMTEDPANVWGTSYPYMKPVDSSVDKNVGSYSYTKNFNLSDVNSKLQVNITQNSDIEILSRTSGDRVNEIKICGKVFSGVRVRSLLGLRSADFDINVNGQTVTINTRGFGHGCGMSQYGANQLAKQGYSYIQILNHYYQLIQIQ